MKKNCLPMLTVIAILLSLYIGSYFFAVRPREVVWYPSKHVPVYPWGQASKPVFAPLVWLDTHIRTDYWMEDLDANPSW